MVINYLLTGMILQVPGDAIEFWRCGRSDQIINGINPIHLREVLEESPSLCVSMIQILNDIIYQYIYKHINMYLFIYNIYIYVCAYVY